MIVVTILLLNILGIPQEVNIRRSQRGQDQLYIHKSIFDFIYCVIFR